jgi:hypothetical protein
MAVYRFRVCLEDNEDVYRDIDIKAAQTFEQFHTTIQEAFKFDAKHSASFFVSDDYWRKNQEITLKKEDLPLDEEEIRKKVEPKKLMSDVKIAKYIEQPHQRFVYIFDTVAQWSFLIEMVKIAEESAKLKYPVCSRSIGTAPKQYKQIPVIKEEKHVDPIMAALLGSDTDIEDEPDDEAFKTIEAEVEGIEAEDLNALEGEEGEESEEGEEESELNGDDEDHSGGFEDDVEKY